MTPVRRRRIRATDETYVSAEEARSAEDPRVPGTDANTLRERGDRPSPPERSRQAVSVGSPGGPSGSDRGLQRPLRLTTLKKPAEFERVLRQGRGMRGSTATIRIFDRGDGGLPRFGFAVSRKTGGAVERNRVKRRWREVARSVGTSVRSGLDCVVIPRPEARAAPFAACREDLWSTMKALGALAGPPCSSCRETGRD